MQVQLLPGPQNLTITIHPEKTGTVMNDLQKMNMQKTIDDVVNEFRQMLENELLPTESTKFLCIDTDGEVAILDSKQIPSGTLIGGDCWQALHPS